MKKLIDTLKNIWKIKELRERILITLSFILVYRLGAQVVLPGIDAGMLSEFQESSQKGLLGLMNLFSGGAFSNASVFALGIMPYITASIMVQLFTIAVPYFQRLQREGESGRRKINQFTRILTVGILCFQGPAYVMNLGSKINSTAFQLDTMFIVSSTIILIAGTMFVMWLGEKITDKGIGNGISLLIMVGIIAGLPYSMSAEFMSRMTVGSGGGLVIIMVEVLVLLAVIAFSILLVQGTRKVPVQYAKRIVGNKQYGGVRQYIPLKVNGAGVMPIIFAQTLMMLPMALIGFSDSASSSFWIALTDFTGVWYNALFAIMIILFTYFYTAITINPVQMADDMKRNGGFIPGVKPGKKTAAFLDTIMSRITLPGSIFLAIIAILPVFAIKLFGIEPGFAQFFGGTSLLIMVGVVLDTLQQIESHLMSRHYDGLMKSGRIKGRTGSAAAY